LELQKPDISEHGAWHENFSALGLVTPQLRQDNGGLIRMIVRKKSYQ
jgi:hypothetical protein